MEENRNTFRIERVPDGWAVMLQSCRAHKMWIQAFKDGKPATFQTREEAIEWAPLAREEKRRRYGDFPTMEPPEREEWAKKVPKRLKV